MTDSEIIQKIREICEEAFDPNKEVSDLHRAQALANVYNTIIHRGENLPQTPEPVRDAQMSIEEALEELRR